MKVTYIGGGSLGIISQMRDLLTWDELPDKVEFALYDRSIERASAVASFVRQSPEYRRASNVTIEVVESLEASLENADYVTVIVCPWSAERGYESERVCLEHNFLGSDNVSQSGPFLALRGGPLVLDIARRMERVAPQGRMIIFTNPIATLAAVVNRATSIPAIGICGGQANHCYDLSRIMGWQKMRFDFEVEVAGTNHISWIKTLRLDGEDFFPKFNARLAEGMDYSLMLPQSMLPHFQYTFPKMIEAYQKFDALLFSTEGDGLPHLHYYHEAVEKSREGYRAPRNPNAGQERHKQITDFLEMSKQVPESAWTDMNWTLEDPKLSTANLVIKGLSGSQPVDVTISYSNNGAVFGFADDDVTEYTAHLANGVITPKACHKLPPATVGVTQAIVESQMLTADAIIHEDSRRFLQSFYAYPLARDSDNVDSLYAKMIEINKPEIPGWVS